MPPAKTPSLCFCGLKQALTKVLLHEKIPNRWKEFKLCILKKKSNIHNNIAFLKLKYFYLKRYKVNKIKMYFKEYFLVHFLSFYTILILIHSLIRGGSFEFI